MKEVEYAKQVMNHVIAYCLLTNAQAVPKHWFPAGFPHVCILRGMSYENMAPVWVRCPVCVPSQLLVPSCLLTGRA